ncbi:MAG: ComF family protein [Pseudomonadota bacterium]
MRHILFPDACLACNRHVAGHGALCATCWQKLTLIAEPVCDVTGAPFSHDFGDGAVSADAIANPPDFHRARAATVHTGTGRQLVTRLKYHDQLLLAPLMACWMTRAGAPMLADADVIIPIPLHWRRFVARRYNQSAELAKHVSKQTGIPLDTATLRRHRATRPQVGLTSNAREDNVRGSFAIVDGHEIAVQGRNIILVDDVYTTGATANAAARALRKAKAQRVDLLTFSRVIPGHEEPQALAHKPFTSAIKRLYHRRDKGDDDG